MGETAIETSDTAQREWRAVGSLAGVLALRMLGLFLVLPGLALYAQRLDGYTPKLAGLAIGIYGLTQACLQLPFGLLSDFFGRRVVISVGLLLFAAGGIVAAQADSIAGVIIGRALQGAGAIAAVMIAMVADLTRPHNRTKAMAVMGITIGAAFVLSLVAGPLLDHWIGIDGIFWLSAGFACAGLLIIWLWVPEPNRPNAPRRLSRETVANISAALKNPQLLYLDGSIFLLHFIMTASFTVLPLVLYDRLHLAAGEHWRLYLPAMLISLIFLMPLIRFAERNGRYARAMSWSIALLLCAQFVLEPVATQWGLTLGLLLFFIGFNFLEALLPSWTSKLVDSAHRGTAMGVYTTAQFLGAFAGAVAAGATHAAYGAEAVFFLLAGVLLLWWLLSISLPAKYKSS